jgi:chemotaxis protein CheD
MALCTLTESVRQQSVGMGQVLLAQDPGQLTAVLGSCVGVALYHPRLRLGALAHIVLPQGSGSHGGPGKFADQAIPHMIRLLEEKGATRHALIAKLAGGACMFGSSGPLQIGDSNIEAVTRLLDEAGIRIAAKDVGGVKGRRITFHTSNGDLIVEVVGKTPCAL